MKTSMFLSNINKLIEQGYFENLDSALYKLKSLGLECVDVDGINIGVKYNLSELKKTLKDNGIGVSSVILLAAFDWENKNSIETYIEKTKKQMEYCNSLSTDIFMPVPDILNGLRDEKERSECQKVIIEYLNKTAMISKEYGVTTALENFSAHRNPYSKPEDMDIIFKNTSGVKFILDTGNFWFSDCDFLKIYEKYKNITEHVHLKDISPNENGFLNINGKAADSNDVGSGIINFSELFKMLKKDGYNKAVSIEICNQDNILDKIVKSLDYVNGLK